jgi:hypothetical protein
MAFLMSTSQRQSILLYSLDLLRNEAIEPIIALWIVTIFLDI